MPKYVMTVTLEAEQFLPDEDQIPEGVVSDSPRDPRTDSRSGWIIRNSHGVTYVRNGDYIVMTPDGDRYRMDRDVFENTYKLAES